MSERRSSRPRAGCSSRQIGGFFRADPASHAAQKPFVSGCDARSNQFCSAWLIAACPPVEWRGAASTAEDVVKTRAAARAILILVDMVKISFVLRAVRPRPTPASLSTFVRGNLCAAANAPNVGAAL